MKCTSRDSRWPGRSCRRVVIRSACTHVADNRSSTVNLFPRDQNVAWKVNNRNCIHQLQNNESSPVFIILPLSGWYPQWNLSTFTVMVTSEPGSSINSVLVYRAIICKACNPSRWVIVGSSHWFSGGLVSVVCQHVQNCGEHAVVQKVYCSRPNANVLVCIHSQRF